MKNPKLLILTLLLSATAHAKLPLNEIEFLRRQTVVVRVALDNPGNATVKKCKIKIDLAILGSKLELIKDNFSKPWSKMNITTEDLHDLDIKAQGCAARASCSAYDTFVASAKVDPSIQQEIELVKAALDKNSQALTSKNYLAAWKTVPKPCLVLKNALK